MCDNRMKRAVALGYFDGLHIAHMRVLEAALAQKENGLQPAVLLFDRSPAEVLTGKTVPHLLTEADRDAILGGMGLELIKLSFEEIKDLTPAVFFETVLLQDLNCGFVSCGYNYTFGRGGAGTRETLASLCRAHGAGIAVCERVSVGGTPVSSSAVRNALAAGRPERAAAMLGRPFSFSAPVVSGEKRGRTLGAPTVNQYLPQGLILPKYGVYACVVEIGEKRYAGAANIGARPTFGCSAVRSETYILGFSGDLYGQNVRIGLLSFLRPERRFPSAEALKAQIALDAAAAGAAAQASPFFCK